LPDLIIFQYVECGEFDGIHTLQSQDLHGRLREAALRCLRGALHEQHHGGGREDPINRALRVGGDSPQREEGC